MRHGALALWGLVALVVVVKLFGLWEPAALRFALLGTYFAVAAGLIVRNQLREVRLSRPAAVADRRADLKDELKSALDFVSHTGRTDWMTLQVRRAAGRVEALDPEELEPWAMPRGLPIAGALSILLFGMFQWGPGWFQELELEWSGPRLRSAQVEQSNANDEDGAESEIAELLTEQIEPDEPDAQFPVIEAFDDLEQTQAEMAASQAELERLEEALAQIGEGLESSASLSELAEALRSQDAQRAAELLRELADRLGEAKSSEELDALLDSLQDAGAMDQDQLAQLLENLEQASQELGDQNLGEAQQALMDAAQQMEAMGQQMVSQPQSDAQMQMQMQGPAGQQMSSEQSGESQSQSNSQSGDTAAQSMGGGQAQLAASEQSSANAVPMDAGPSGNASGQGSEDAVLGEATSLEVQLEMELLSKEELEPIPEEIFDKQSRQEESTIDYETIRQSDNYAEEEATSAEQIPWRYRDLIKRYFITLRSKTSPKSTP